jgi:hypothetical protein
MLRNTNMTLPPVGQSPYFDAAVLGVIVTAWFQVIPAIAALLAVIWYVILIWESKTIRAWTGRTEKSTTYVVTDNTPEQP